MTGQIQRPASRGRQMLGSFISAAVAWGLVNLCCAGREYFTQDPDSSFPWWAFLDVFIPYSALFIFGAWLVVLMPLCLFVPSRIFLWGWPIFMLAGALIGGVATFAVRLTHPNFTGQFVALGAETGGICALMACLTAGFFRYGRKG